jgi:hypothetical protein
MGEGEEEERDSWSKTFDPEFAVRLVQPTEPPHSWEEYVTEPRTNNQLQRICELVQGATASSSLVEPRRYSASKHSMDHTRN